MKIVLDKAGKKFYREWIFRKMDYSVEEKSRTVILGPNGSGKSTFLQTLAGLVTLNEGTISFSHSGKDIPIDQVFRSVSMAAPYLELIEEFTLAEIVDFHFQFKQIVNGLSKKDVIDITELSAKKDSVYKYFSSGMKQRVKLALAVLSDVPLLLLDEPCGNLDAKAMTWYNKLIADYANGKTIIVASNNQKEEFEFCTASVKIDDYRNQ
ncbi:MAG: ATP-binding cassette domain-containing protein [Bacteroidetes bacterium]|nr:ATP-binding cassette domain-containing protein [Bacteroidota bacterium]